MFVHLCPAHGEEFCLMGGDSKAHACRNGGSFVFASQAREREITILGAIRHFVEAPE
jgi:hypothetical protein